MHRRTLLASAGALAVAGRFSRAKADTPGVTDTQIKIGNTSPFSGPASAYGVNAKTHAAYFRMINESGGVAGRKINYISLDDAYSPPKTVEQTRKLVEQEGVAFIFAGLGTPTQSAVRQYMNRKEVPQIFVSSGADKFADPEHFPWTIGFQPSYRLETAIYGKYILRERPNARIGVLYQNDDYGKDCLIGLKAGLGDRAATMVVKEVSYEVTDATIDSQATSLRSAGCDVVLTAAQPKWAAQMIRKIADLDWKPLHIMNFVSTSVGAVIEPAGRENAIGMLTATSQKDHTDPQWANDPGIAEWRAFMARYMPNADMTDGFPLWAYGNAIALIQVLRQCGADMSRANIMKQAANLQELELPNLLPGIRVNTSATNFHPIRAMRLARFNGRSWELFGSVISA